MTKNKTVTKTKPRKSTPSKKAASLSGRLQDEIEKITERVENLFSSRPSDICAAIKKDHEGLRNFLKLLKDTDADMMERRKAYELFSALLKSHSDVEENVVYKTAENFIGKELQIKIAEGYVEHQLAKDLMNRIENSEDATEWSAHANVLSEIVEHHLKEEERDLLPLIKKAESADLDRKMLTQYLAQRQKSQKKVTKKNAGVLET